VQSALALAELQGLVCSADLRARVARVDSYYGLRYPAGGPTSLSTAELEDVDEAIFEVWDAFKAVNADCYYTTGIMWPIYGYLMEVEDRPDEPNPMLLTYFKFMTDANRSYERRRADIERGIKDRLVLWYLPTG